MLLDAKMSSNLQKYGEPINSGQVHLLSKNTWKYKAFVRPLGRGPGFRNISPMALSRGISKDLVGMVGKTVVLKDGGLLLEVCSAEMLRKLLNISPLVICDVRCFAYTPDDMVTVRGVIHNIPMDQSPEELTLNLEAQVSSKDIFIMKASRILNSFKKPTTAVTLTFFGDLLPDCVRISRSNFYIPVSAYITPPLRCFKCQRYGHTSNRCKNVERCARCADHHPSGQCHSETFRCANCLASHTARSARCPVYLWASQVQQYRDTKGCSWARAELACGTCPDMRAASPCHSEIVDLNPPPKQNLGPRFTLKVNEKDQIRTLEYTNLNKQTIIARTPLDSLKVKALEESTTSSKQIISESMENSQSPATTPYRKPDNSEKVSIEQMNNSDSSVSSLNLSSPTPNSTPKGKSSTSNNNGGEPTLTDVSSEVSSFRDVSSPPDNTGNKTEVRDASTQTELMSKIEKFVQTETLFENNFLNKFDLELLLANLKSLISELDSKSGNYTQNFLKQKFISSFIASYQKLKPTKLEEDKSSRRVLSSDKPARRATPVKVSRPAKPSSLPKPVGSRLKCLNSPLKTAVGFRRLSLGSPQAFRWVKKQIFKP